MKRNRVQIKRYEVDSIFWDKVFECFPIRLKKSDDIYSLFYGYKDKINIYYNEEYMILTETKFNYICKLLYNESIIDFPEDWRQVAVRLNDTIDKPVKTITGTQAYKYITHNILEKYYTTEEIEDILNSHTAAYDEGLKQYHCPYMGDKNVVYKYNEVWKYDIHKAHASIIMQLFPKAKKDIINLLNKASKAKTKGDLSTATVCKAYINYYVGALVNHGHRETYNYIVQTITKKLFNTSMQTGGIIIYANTDSFCIIEPINILEDTKDYGEFGLEYHGPAYTVRGNNYTLYQFGDTLVGSCRKKLRDQFDLSNGIIVQYNQNKKEIYNVCIEKVNVEEL